MVSNLKRGLSLFKKYFSKGGRKRIHDIYTGREYYSHPAKKAANLQNLDELRLSKPVERYLGEHCKTLPEIIWQGRLTAYLVDRDASYIKKTAKSLLKLAAALDREGYLRHDFVANSFTLNLLYMIVYNNQLKDAPQPTVFEDLCKVYQDNLDFSIDYVIGNQNYETYKNPTTSQCQKIQAATRGCLTEKEFQIISKRYGIEGKVMDVCELATLQNVTPTRIRQIEALAIRKLHNTRALPAILASSIAQDQTVDSLINRLKTLRQNPLFQEEFELRQKLREITLTPYDYAVKAKEFLNSEIKDQTEIECLELTIRTYQALKRAGIHTLSDIIDYPSMDWLRIKGLSLISIREIERKVQKFGYTNFRINPRL